MITGSNVEIYRHCVGSRLAIEYRDLREIVRAINEVSRLHGRAEPLAAPRRIAQPMDASHDVTARSLPLTLVIVAVVILLPTLRLTQVLQILSLSFQVVRVAP
jgi:hypothetical protein